MDTTWNSTSFMQKPRGLFWSFSRVGGLQFWAGCIPKLLDSFYKAEAKHCSMNMLVGFFAWRSRYIDSLIDELQYDQRAIARQMGSGYGPGRSKEGPFPVRTGPGIVICAGGNQLLINTYTSIKVHMVAYLIYVLLAIDGPHAKAYASSLLAQLTQSSISCFGWLPPDINPCSLAFETCTLWGWRIYCFGGYLLFELPVHSVSGTTGEKFWNVTWDIHLIVVLTPSWRAVAPLLQPLFEVTKQENMTAQQLQVLRETLKSKLPIEIYHVGPEDIGHLTRQIFEVINPAKASGMIAFNNYPRHRRSTWAMPASIELLTCWKRHSIRHPAQPCIPATSRTPKNQFGLWSLCQSCVPILPQYCTQEEHLHKKFKSPSCTEASGKCSKCKTAFTFEHGHQFVKCRSPCWNVIWKLEITLGNACNLPWKLAWPRRRLPQQPRIDSD